MEGLELHHVHALSRTQRKKVSAQLWLEYEVATNRCDATGIVQRPRSFH